LCSSVVAEREKNRGVNKSAAKVMTLWRYTILTSTLTLIQIRIRHDTRCYSNVRSKADMSQLNLYRTEPTTKKCKKNRKSKSKKRICSEVTVNSEGDPRSQS